MNPLTRPKRPSGSSEACRRMCLDTHLQQDKLGWFMTCHVCGGRIDAVRKPKTWQADHWPKPVAVGGEDLPENLQPLCIVCATSKNAEDWRNIAHGRRASDKHFGVKQSKGWGRR